MCGIAVAVDWDGTDAVVRRLIAGMLHRGDITDPLVTVGNNIAMCTRRLRIVDAAHGTQPQASFDERFLVCLNGEIYNHAELRRELEALGVQFRTVCDTEVVANVLRVWGASGIKRLAGMYAFVAIDVAAGEFLAARDPFGVKPLYLIKSGKGFLFCSEVRPLLESTESGDVLFLPPGYMLTRNFCGRHYHLPSPTASCDASPQELDRILSEAVRIRLPSDLPVAMLFSGGIDSTLVAHYARRFCPAIPGYIAARDGAPDLSTPSALPMRLASICARLISIRKTPARSRWSKGWSMLWRPSNLPLFVRACTLIWSHSAFIGTVSASRYAVKAPTSCLRVTSRSNTLLPKRTPSAAMCRNNVWR